MWKPNSGVIQRERPRSLQAPDTTWLRRRRVMERHSLTHLLDGELVRGLKSNLAKERVALADVLVHLAEVEARQLYREAGFPSLHDYCVLGLHLSHDAAKKRIHAA